MSAGVYRDLFGSVSSYCYNKFLLLQQVPVVEASSQVQRQSKHRHAGGAPAPQWILLRSAEIAMSSPSRSP